MPENASMDDNFAQLMNRKAVGRDGTGEGPLLLRRVLEAAPDGILFLDAQTGTVLGNRAFEELLGRRIDPAAGAAQELGIIHTVEGASVPMDEFPSLRALRSGERVRQELVFVHANGRRIPVEEHAGPVIADDGSICGVVVTCHDLTVRKKLEHAREELLEAVDRERTYVRTIVEAAPDGILFLDAKSGAVLGNRAFEELLGKRIDPQAGVAQEVGVIHSPEGSPVPMQEFPSVRALRSGTVVRQELVFVHADGRRIPVEEHAGAIVSPGEGTIGVVVTCRDLRPQKVLERVREEFAAMVAHDLRNPIQSTLVQLAMMREDIQNGKSVSATALERLARAARRMARLTNDLLESVRIDLARVALNKSRQDAAQVVRDVIEQVQPTVGDHSIGIHAQAHLPQVLVDTPRLQQILTNLLENAAKYSPRGAPIDVSVEARGLEVDIAVHDRGGGIAPEEIPRLFDRFYQTERARLRQSGLGLGLYIVRGLVEAHGGRLSVESAVDRGTTFHVTLPAAPLARR